MKKLLALFLAMTMVFTLFPVSALAEGDAEGEPSAEKVTQIAEEPQTEPGETPEETAGDPQENHGENPEKATNDPQEGPEETAEETPEPEGITEETPEESPEAEVYAASEEGTSAEDELIAAIADDSVNGYGVTGDCVLSSNLTIPADFVLSVGEQGTLTVQNGITLTNNGTMVVDGGLVIESGAKLVNNEDFQARESAQVSMAGTFENTKWASAYAEGWNCTGTLVNNGGNFALFSDAATADELEAALKADGACVSVTADITLDRSITVTEGKQININPGVKLTVPASYTVTNNGSICVYGTLEINGTYSGERIVLVMSAGTLVPETIPHQKEGVLIEQITVLGPDTVQSGSSTWYGADVLPANAWNAWLTWSIVSGSDLATITEYGELTAGDADGEVTIRATAADGSGVCGEKTVTIEGSGLTVEERLRNAIARGDNWFNIAGDCVLSANLTVPANFNLFWNQGTLTIPDGVTLTIERSGYIAVSDMVIQSGGKIVNNGAISAGMSAKITVESGGTLENNLSVSVSSGGSFHNNGTYIPGARGNLYFDIGEGNLDTDLTGVDLKLVALTRSVKKEADIRALFAEAENVNSVVATLFESTAITLSDDLTIPENGDVTIDGNAVFTVPQGKTLTNNGSFTLCSNARLIVESGAKLVNNNNFYSFYSEDSVQISIAGTVENTGRVYVPVKSWNCTGTLVNNGYLDLFADVTTADEMETAFRSATRVYVTADITLDRSITVPDDVQVDIQYDVKLTVPASYTITNNGSIFVYGTLEVSGTYEGGKVRVFQDAVLTPDSIPHQKQGVLAEQITITGADSVQPGGSAQYDVEILPDNAWETVVEWSIVSGKELAEIDIYGNLTAGDTAGKVTIRATAYDGSEVCGEKTVTIEGTALTIEEQLRAAIADDGVNEYHITGDCELSADLDIPANFSLYVDEGTLTIPNGVTMTAQTGSVVDVRANIVALSGGEFVFYDTLNVYETGSLTVDAGATLGNKGSMVVFGGEVHVNGTYYYGVPGGVLEFYIRSGTKASDYRTKISGIPLDGILLTCEAESDEDIRALYAESADSNRLKALLVGSTAITLSDDLTIPKNAHLIVGEDAMLTVPQGKILTNNGWLPVYGRLIIESDAKLVNNNHVEAEEATQVSVAGTFKNTGWTYANTKSWNCTGTFVNDGGNFSLSAEVTTAAELEAAIEAGASFVTATANITLDRSITIPDGVLFLILPDMKLTVPASYTLANEGTILVAGTLEVTGTYRGEKVLVRETGTVTGENIPQRNEGTLATAITITGDDTVQPGSSTQYSVEILPDNAWETRMNWSIVSGEDLATINGGGYLTAGDTAGTVTIRADAVDGSDVSAEKTVTIKEAVSIEEQLRAAIASGKNAFTITGDCTLSRDLIIPSNFALRLEQGTLIIPDGVTMTAQFGSFVGIGSDTVIRSGGKLVVYDNINVNVYETGSLTVDDGGTLENWGWVSVLGGEVHVNGTYAAHALGDMTFFVEYGDYKTKISGVSSDKITLFCQPQTEADIRSLYEQAGDVLRVRAQISETTEITLSGDLEIPKNGTLALADSSVLTIPAGKTVTNNGSITLWDDSCLIVESGATLMNYGSFTMYDSPQITMAGTFDNYDYARITADGWNCTGTLKKSAGTFALCKAVTTAAELEKALQPGTEIQYVEVTADIVADRSITVPKGMELDIEEDVKLTIPAPYTLTNDGAILVYGTLEVSGTYSGEKVYVFGTGTLTPNTIPHYLEGVLAEKITITGPDTVSVGESVQYTAEVLPDNAWEPWVSWEIVSGNDLVSIDSSDLAASSLTARSSGTFTIRATSVVNSEIYAEKTVTIGEAALTVEDQLRNAMASGADEYRITGDCTLTRDLALPDYFTLRQEGGTLTVPDGVTFTVTAEAYFTTAANVVIQSGGKFVNCGTTHSHTNGSITVETGGTVENIGWIQVLKGGGFHNSGTYTPGGDARLYFNVGDCDWETDLTGVDRSLVSLLILAYTEEDLQTLFAEAENVQYAECRIPQTISVTLTGDLTVPTNGSLFIYGTLTVAQGAKLTNNGEIRVWGSLSGLVIESDAKIVNNNSFGADNGAQVSVAGTFENNSWANIRATGWNCTGELVNSGTFLLFAEAVTAAELEAALQSGMDGVTANIVEIMADITLDRSITVPTNVQLNIFNATLTVPAPYTLTNEGEITVAGTLKVTGTYSGNAVNLLAGGTLIPDDIPHRRMDVSVEQITITGEDTLAPGGHTRYSATVLPEDATDWRVEWSIVSGGDIATMLDDGLLLAGTSTGEVTIRATAMDGTGVYGEKTVKLEGDYVSGEEQARAAIENNEEMFEIYGDCTLSADLTVPAGFRLYAQYGTLTVPDGITLTVAQDGHFYSCSNVVVQSGGKIVNCGVLGTLSNGGITVEAGGTLKNNGYFHLFDGGTFRNYGTYTPGEDSELYFSDGNYKTDVTGVDGKLLTVQNLVQTEEELRAQLEDSVNVKQLTARLYGTAAVTLSDDLTIPETGCIMLAGESSLTVPTGKTLTNNGSIRMIENTRLTVESGAKLINNDYIGSTEETVLSVAGTLESTGWGYVHIDSWHCTGTFVNGGQGIALFEWAATEEELEAALQSGANTVEITADITLGGSAAVPEAQFYRLASFASAYADTSAANGSLVIPEGVNLVIQENVELTIPAEYTLTCLGQISVLGTLNVDGTYSGGQVLVYESGTVTSEEEIPQQNEGVPVTDITVTGEDTVLPGGSAQYIAAILPENAWVQQVKWSVTAGEELAEIDADGVLFANGTTGTVAIRATAIDGSEVYGEKTVTIEGASIEEQLRAAIANGDTQFNINGSFTLSGKLTIPANFNLYVDRGTLTIPNDVELVIGRGGFFGSCADTVVQSGGKITNNGTINSYMGGSITVEAGGTLENNWDIFVFYEGSFHNYGTYTSNADGYLNIDIDECDLDTDLTGVDLKQVTLEARTETEADIRALFARVDTVYAVAAKVEETSITLSDDLTIPNVFCIISIGENGVLTVPQSKKLTNNGSINLYSNGRLVIESGATLVNNNNFSAWEDAQVSVAGTFENNGWANVNAGSWNCTGKLVDNEGSFTLSAEVTTAADLEAALKAGATSVEVTEDITLDRSITIPENATLYIDHNVTLTVPEGYTLTNNGSIYVDGTLDVSGTYKGEKVMVYYDGTVTGENIPQRNEGVLATEIKITGATTVSVGGSAQYTAEILPENAWVMWADWSIVSGGDLAEIYPGGYLEVGNTPGEITIRADAADGSLVYAELTVTITDRVPGDVNGDGKVNGKDVTALSRYLAGWDVDINLQAANVNGDSVVNGKDVTALSRYLAGWNVELK